MRRWSRAGGLRVLALAGGVSLFSSGCRGMLDAQSPQATRIETLWWVLFGLAALVFVVVLALLCYALFRRRDRRSALESRRNSMAFIFIGGGIVPFAILAAVFGYGVGVMAQSAPTSPNDGRIEITASQFKYSVVYSNGVTETDVLHLPVDRETELVLRSADVIHSLWIPQLNGKEDMIPGKTNVLVLKPTKIGEYRGQCAEFCGVGHASMIIHVIVESVSDYEAWLSEAHRLQGS